jgi:hypothetical protein
MVLNRLYLFGFLVGLRVWADGTACARTNGRRAAEKFLLSHYLSIFAGILFVCDHNSNPTIFSSS